MTVQALKTYEPPAPSKATRRIARRSRASLRGELVAQLPADNRPRRIVFESKLEHRFLLLTLARRDVHDIWDQPPAIAYRDARGRRRTHTFDFLVTFESGRRIATAIKPEKLVHKRRFLEELQSIRSAVRPDFADDVVLVTDRQIDKRKAAIAARFHEFRRDQDGEADAEVARIAASLIKGATVADIIEMSGFGGRAYRAVVRAIYSGGLGILDPLALTFQSWLSVEVSA